MPRLRVIVHSFNGNTPALQAALRQYCLAQSGDSAWSVNLTLLTTIALRPQERSVQCPELWSFDVRVFRLRIGFGLACQHRPILRAAKEWADVFAVFEDDIILRQDTLDSFWQLSSWLKLPYVPGLVRYEHGSVNGTGPNSTILGPWTGHGMSAARRARIICDNGRAMTKVALFDGHLCVQSIMYSAGYLITRRQFDYLELELGSYHWRTDTLWCGRTKRMGREWAMMTPYWMKKLKPVIPLSRLQHLLVHHHRESYFNESHFNESLGRFLPATENRSRREIDSQCVMVDKVRRLWHEAERQRHRNSSTKRVTADGSARVNVSRMEFIYDRTKW